MKLIFIVIGYIFQFLMFIIKSIGDALDFMIDLILDFIEVILDWCEDHINEDDNED